MKAKEVKVTVKNRIEDLLRVNAVFESFATQHEIGGRLRYHLLVSIEEILTNIIKKHSDLQETVQMGNRWLGGKLVLVPGNAGLQPKEIPIDVFFNKIIMLRDRLRVMEQRINANEKLSEEEKINLQQYLTRIYGSLTTFNVLFKEDKDHFVGERSKGE